MSLLRVTSLTRPASKPVGLGAARPHGRNVNELLAFIERRIGKVTDPARGAMQNGKNLVKWHEVDGF